MIRGNRFLRNISLKSTLFNLAVLVLGYLAIHSYQTWDTPKGKAPVLIGANLLNGETIDLARMEKPVLVHFWATWCRICQFEHASIQRIANDYPVISIASQSGEAAKVLAFMRNEALSFPVILDEYGKIFQKWGGMGYPTSFIIDKNNQVKFVETGFTTEMGLTRISHRIRGFSLDP